MNDQMTQRQIPGTDEQPLGSISLSLSGGGGRAAGFHLGTLAYLDRVKLLKDVSVLSSVSGGSHVAAKKWPRVEDRGDSGFCRDEILTWCEAQHRVDYVIGWRRTIGSSRD